MYQFYLVCPLVLQQIFAQHSHPTVNIVLYVQFFISPPLLDMKISPQQQLKSTKTSLFLKFLIKICFLPITFEENDGTIRFKWISIKTLAHMFIYCGGFVFCCIFVHFVDTDMIKRISQQNVIESLSISSGSITVVAIIFPLILGRQFNQTDMSMVWDEKLAFPKQGLRTIFSAVGQNIGTNVGIMGFFLQFDLSWKTLFKIQLILFLGNFSFSKTEISPLRVFDKIILQ